MRGHRYWCNNLAGLAKWLESHAFRPDRGYSLLFTSHVMDKQLEKYLPAFRQQLAKWVFFTDEEWALLTNQLQLRSLAKKAHFTQAGEVCQELGFILTGAVRLYHVKDGEEITSYFCLNNEFISSYKSFLKQVPGSSFIQALEATLVITFSHSAIQQLLAHPLTAYKMERFGRLIAEELVFCYEDRVQAFVTQTPEERYASLLTNNPRVVQHIPQHYLATYLGITPVSLSRIRRRLVAPVS